MPSRTLRGAFPLLQLLCIFAVSAWAQGDPFADFVRDVASARATVELLPAASVAGLLGAGANVPASYARSAGGGKPPVTPVYRTLRQFRAADGRVGLFNSSIVLKPNAIWLDEVADLTSISCALDRASNVTTVSLVFTSPATSNASRVSAPGAILVGGQSWRCGTAGSPAGGNSSPGFTLRVVSAAPSGSTVTVNASPAQLTDAVAGMSIQYFIGDPAVLPLSQRLRRYPTKQEIAAELAATGNSLLPSANASAATTGPRRLLSSPDAAASRELLATFRAPEGTATIFNVNLNAGPFSGSARATGSIGGSYVDVTCNGVLCSSGIGTFIYLRLTLSVSLSASVNVASAGSNSASPQVQAPVPIPGLSIPFSVLGTGVTAGLQSGLHLPYSFTLTQPVRWSYAWANSVTLELSSRGLASVTVGTPTVSSTGALPTAVSGNFRVGLKPSIRMGFTTSVLGIRTPLSSSTELSSYTYGVHSDLRYAVGGATGLSSARFSGCGVRHQQEVALSVFQGYSGASSPADAAPFWGACALPLAASSASSPSPTPSPSSGPSTSSSAGTCYQSSACNGACGGGASCAFLPNGPACAPSPYSYACQSSSSSSQSCTYSCGQGQRCSRSSDCPGTSTCNNLFSWGCMTSCTCSAGTCNRCSG